MSKMTILLILVWNVSVNIAFMVLHAVHFHFKHCGIGFLKLVSSLDYQIHYCNLGTHLAVHTLVQSRAGSRDSLYCLHGLSTPL